MVPMGDYYGTAIAHYSPDLTAYLEKINKPAATASRTRKGGKRTKKDRKKTKKKGNTVKNKQIIIGGTIEKMIDYVELFDVYKDTLSYGLLQDKLYINLSVLTSKFINSLDNPSSLYTGYFDNEIYNIKSNITDIRSLINSKSSVMVGGVWWGVDAPLVDAMNPFPEEEEGGGGHGFC